MVQQVEVVLERHLYSQRVVRVLLVVLLEMVSLAAQVAQVAWLSLPLLLSPSTISTPFQVELAVQEVQEVLLVHVQAVAVAVAGVVLYLTEK
jgi:hypothetical protein